MTFYRDLPVKLPPVERVEEFRASEATAFSETVPRHVKQKNGVQLRDLWRRGQDVNVVVLDTGIDKEHVEVGDLQNAFRGGLDFTGNGRRSFWDDNAHGTHCAGIIAADNEDKGTASILDQCNLYVGKVLDRRGTGYSSWIANGFNWAFELDPLPHIVSVSIGGGHYQPMRDAITRLNNAGVEVIVAAGNAGRQGAGFPAQYPECHSIAACNFDYELAGFSSWYKGNLLADFGVGIYSTVLDGGYAIFNGTSMATPGHAAVAGARVGLELTILGKARRLNHAERVDLYADSRWMVDRGRQGPDVGFGHGTIDLPKFVEGYSKDLRAMLPKPGPPVKPGPGTGDGPIARIQIDEPGEYGVFKM